VRDVVDVMVRESGHDVPVLRADGSAAANDLLLQLQADQLGIPVERPEELQTTGLGAAFLAGLGTGVWSMTDLGATWRSGRRFEPAGVGGGDDDEGSYRRWRAAVERTKQWPLPL
jgi:glycerol kinase